jgi:Flp pilus assembly protein TadD
MRLLASAALVVVLAAAAGGCKTTGSSETTGSIATPTGPRPEADWRRDVETYGERYRANNRDVEAAIRYAAALRGIGQRSQAAAVLEQASMLNPKNRTILGAYGRALADAGSYAQALDVLERAHSPDQPDWRILSVQGAVLDQLGRWQEARQHYEAALRIAPNEPSVLSNLGLSYALTRDLAMAESTLRRAVERPGADPRVRQNLALVVGLQGRFEEAEQIARADLPSESATANVAYLRRMLAEPDQWKKLAQPAQHVAAPTRAAAATPRAAPAPTHTASVPTRAAAPNPTASTPARAAAATPAVTAAPAAVPKRKVRETPKTQPQKPLSLDPLALNDSVSAETK